LLCVACIAVTDCKVVWLFSQKAVQSAVAVAFCALETNYFNAIHLKTLVDKFNVTEFARWR
jgi:hypothetical protein